MNTTPDLLERWGRFAVRRRVVCHRGLADRRRRAGDRRTDRIRGHGEHAHDPGCGVTTGGRGVAAIVPATLGRLRGHRPGRAGRHRRRRGAGNHRVARSRRRRPPRGGCRGLAIRAGRRGGLGRSYGRDHARAVLGRRRRRPGRNGRGARGDQHGRAVRCPDRRARWPGPGGAGTRGTQRVNRARTDRRARHSLHPVPDVDADRPPDRQRDVRPRRRVCGDLRDDRRHRSQQVRAQHRGDAGPGRRHRLRPVHRGALPRERSVGGATRPRPSGLRWRPPGSRSRSPVGW